MSTQSLSTALAYLRSVVEARLQVHLGKRESVELNAHAYLDDDSAFARFFQTHCPGFEEFILILLALVPHVQPQFFSQIMAEYLPEGGEFPEFGGAKGQHHRGLLPTGETAQFVIGGHDLAKRLEVQRLLGSEHWLAQKQVLSLEPVREGEPPMSGRLLLDPETVELLTLGTVGKPRFSTDFPAERLTTQMDWVDLVLHPDTLRQIREIEHWIAHHAQVFHDWGMGKRVKPGYRALFYGPPGTGKTLTATLLGKYTGRDVFRIDLSKVVSKYIGETEKNLARMFAKAENKDWVLFFDEADALFGKRTDIRDAHDKYANQEVAYLLQRIESHDGLVILASNQRANIDEAFARRFQAIIHFPMPQAAERLSIWQKAFPEKIAFGPDLDWAQVAARFELSGANIQNIAHYCVLEAVANGSLRIGQDLLEQGIYRELEKEGKLA